MKAGILTFHQADSYGALLQALALQRTVGKLGADSEFITVTEDRRSDGPEPVAAGPGAIFAKRIMEEGAARARLFEGFRKEHLKCAPPCSKSGLRLEADKYDLFIAGSDQIWNFRIPGADERYFLTFAPPEKRFSYAASFGSEDIPEKAKSWCAEQLSAFSGLSVREESGRKIIKDLTGREAEVSLDPTLLLDETKWAELATCPEEKPYFLLFMLKFDPVLLARAKKASAESGCRLRTVSAAFMPQLGFGSWSGVSVEDWIGLIAGSSGVFTNSFHGTVFSLLFGRPVSVALLGGELSGRNGRITELLSLAGAEDALNGSLVTIPEGGFSKRISAEKERSLAYLKEILV